jgi:hypothetical protein
MQRQASEAEAIGAIHAMTQLWTPVGARRRKVSPGARLTRNVRAGVANNCYGTWL